MELNPYSPPPHELTQHLALSVRPSKAASWLYWAIRGGNGPARRDPRDGNLLLSASFFPLLLTFCSMVLAPLCVIGLAAINPPAPADSLCPIYLVTLFELIGLLNLLSVLASGQVAISRHSVQVFKPYCHRVICWRDIVRVRLQSNGSFVLESTNQDLITIDSCVTGLPEFIEALERFLPAEVRLDCQGELDDYRNFVGLGDSIRHDRG